MTACAVSSKKKNTSTRCSVPIHPCPSSAASAWVATTTASACSVNRSNIDVSAPEKFFFFQAEDGIRDLYVTGVQTCALPISEQDLAQRRVRKHRLRDRVQ